MTGIDSSLLHSADAGREYEAIPLVINLTLSTYCLYSGKTNSGHVALYARLSLFLNPCKQKAHEI